MKTVPAGAFAVAAITMGASSAQTAATTERPEWKVGDKWSFRSVENPGAKESGWSREVVAVQPDGRCEIATETGRRYTFDGEGNRLAKRGPEYTWRRFKFPMTVGMSWSHERKLPGKPSDALGQSSWRVSASNPNPTRY